MLSSLGRNPRSSTAHGWAQHSEAPPGISAGAGGPPLVSVHAAPQPFGIQDSGTQNHSCCNPRTHNGRQQEPQPAPGPDGSSRTSHCAYPPASPRAGPPSKFIVAFEYINLGLKPGNKSVLQIRTLNEQFRDNVPGMIARRRMKNASPRSCRSTSGRTPARGARARTMVS